MKAMMLPIPVARPAKSVKPNASHTFSMRYLSAG
jgi:hypothetical protein